MHGEGVSWIPGAEARARWMHAGAWAIGQTRAGGGKMGIIGSPRLTLGARALAGHPGLGLAGPVRAFTAFPCVRSDNTAPRGRSRAGIEYVG